MPSLSQMSILSVHAVSETDTAWYLYSKYEALAEKRRVQAAKERLAALDGNTGKKPKRLKTGSIEEMKQNAAAIQSYAERKAAEKADKNSH